jgi:RimJ/RimL family protein N-acetyltransferase
MVAMTFLETPRLIFRSHEAQDESAFVRMQTDPEARRYVGGPPWPLEKALSRFRNDYLGQPTEVFGLWATILKSRNTYIGCGGLRASGKPAKVYLAFYFARAFWRQGFASEVSRAFIDVAFKRLRLPRIFAEVDSRNEVSIHILEKLAFHYVSEECIPASGRILHTYERGNPAVAGDDL